MPEKRYACHDLSLESLLEVQIEGELQAPEVTIFFLEKNAAGIHPNNDDPMVISIICEDWKIKRVLVD